MIKFLMGFFSVLFMFGCSSAPVQNESRPLYHEPKINLTLNQVLTYPEYPDQSQLSALMQDKLTAALAEEGVLVVPSEAEALAVSVNMNYQRIFAGEATPFPMSSAGRPVVHYVITVSRGDIVVAAIEERNITVNRGFLKNLKTLFMFYMDGSPEAEAQDVDVIARSIASSLAGLKIRE